MKEVYEVQSYIKRWANEANPEDSVPRTTESQHDTPEEATVAAQLHEATYSHEACEVRRYPGDVGIWP